MNPTKLAILFKRTDMVPFDFNDSHFEAIRSTVPGIEIIRAYDEPELLSKTDDAEIFLTWGLYSPIAFCKKAKSLKWIHAISAGVEGLMAPEIVGSGVKISSTKEIHGIPMSEQTLCYILCFLRRFPLISLQQQRKIWLNPLPDETFGKTVGIIGLGSIGQAIAKKCKLMGLRVVATKRTPVQCEWIDRLYSDTELDKLLRESDFVVSTLPVTPQTVKLIDQSKFKMMKKTAYFINVGRGQTVDEEALIGALKNGVIAGAALDVFEVEPLPQDSPLWDLPNVVVTPHSSAYSPLYLDRAIPVFCENMRRFLNGEKLLFEASEDLGY